MACATTTKQRDPYLKLLDVLFNQVALVKGNYWTPDCVKVCKVQPSLAFSHIIWGLQLDIPVSKKHQCHINHTITVINNNRYSNGCQEILIPIPPPNHSRTREQVKTANSSAQRFGCSVQCFESLPIITHWIESNGMKIGNAMTFHKFDYYSRPGIQISNSMTFHDISTTVRSLYYITQYRNSTIMYFQLVQSNTTYYSQPSNFVLRHNTTQSDTKLEYQQNW